MPTMLRNRKTGELFHMNGDMARHDDMVPVEVPDLSKAKTVRGVVYLDEKDVFDSPEDDAPPPPSKTRAKRTKKVAKPADDVDLSDIDLSDVDA